MKKDKRVQGNIFINILSYICIVILIVVTSFLSFYIIENTIAKNNNQRPLISLFTIVSPSMEPSIKVYDVIFNKRVNEPSELKVGDVITFYSDTIDTSGYTVTHRISKIYEDNGITYFVTKGDNNQTADEGRIEFDDIVGKYIFKIPFLGRLQFFISSKLGWLIIILIPASLVIIYDIYKLGKLRKTKKEENKIEIQKETMKEMETFENKRIKELIEKANKITKK